MSQLVLVQVIFVASICLVVIFGAMVFVSVLAASGRLHLPRRTTNRLYLASMVALVAGLLLMLTTVFL